MARLSDACELPAVGGDRLTDRISIGVLARIVPRDVIDEVLAETRRTEKRTRLLPARVVVYFTMAMCLFFDDDYEEVMRRLVGTLRWLGSRRLMAVDGFFLDVADTAENAARFGRSTNGPKSAAYPQVQVVAIAECGTHAVVAAAIGGVTAMNGHWQHHCSTAVNQGCC